MSEPPIPSPPTVDDDDGEDLTAAEYALGVLDRAGRAAVEARAGHDAPFADTVLAWVKRFEPLIGGVAPVEPSPRLWSRIDAAIGSAGVPSVGAQPAAPPMPANDAPGLGLWRAWAVGASAIAAALILFIAVRPTLTGGGPRPLASAAGRTLVATLAMTETKASAFMVAYNPREGMLYAKPAGDFSIPRARSAELWLIPADGKPRPMGVVDAAKAAAMPMPAAFRALAREKAVLALSIEPPGGSATGLPTGPVVATGALDAV